MSSAEAVQILPGRIDPGAQLARESALLMQQASCFEAAPQALLWRGTQSLIASPSDRRLPDFARACAALAERGWPVILRPTGGSAVPLLAGVVNLTLVLPWRGTAPGLSRPYRVLCGTLVSALQDLGVAASTGAVAGAICDGQFNVRVGTRKLVGTSQRQSARGGGGAVLLHAGILVDVDVQEATQVVRDFYRLAGGAQDYLPEALVSLRECLPTAPADLTGQFIATLAGQLAREPPAL